MACPATPSGLQSVHPRLADGGTSESKEVNGEHPRPTTQYPRWFAPEALTVDLGRYEPARWLGSRQNVKNTERVATPRAWR